MAVAPATIREAHSNLTKHTKNRTNNLFQQNKHISYADVPGTFQEMSHTSLSLSTSGESIKTIVGRQNPESKRTANTQYAIRSTSILEPHTSLSPESKSIPRIRNTQYAVRFLSVNLLHALHNTQYAIRNAELCSRDCLRNTTVPPECAFCVYPKIKIRSANRKVPISLLWAECDVSETRSGLQMHTRISGTR